VAGRLGSKAHQLLYTAVSHKPEKSRAENSCTGTLPSEIQAATLIRTAGLLTSRTSVACPDTNPSVSSYVDV